MSKNYFKTDICDTNSLNFKILSFNIEEGEREYIETETITDTFYKFKKYKDTKIIFNCYLKAKTKAELIDLFSDIKYLFFKKQHSLLYINNYNFFFKIKKINILNKSLLKSTFLKFDIEFTCNYFKYKKEIVNITNENTNYSQDILCNTLLKIEINRDNKDKFAHKQTILINNVECSFYTKEPIVYIDLDNKQIMSDNNTIINYMGTINFNDINNFNISLSTEDLGISGTIELLKMIY